MGKGLVSYVKDATSGLNDLGGYAQNVVSNLNDLRYFGDVVLYRSNNWEGKGIGWFTESKFTHCALRTGKNKAEGVRLNYWNLLPFVKKREFIRKHDLENPRKEYVEYLILRHKRMNLLGRIGARKIYNGMNIEDYDVRLFLRKAVNHGIRKLRKKLRLKEIPSSDSRDLSREGSYLCGSVTAKPLSPLEKLTTKLNIDWSQVEPQNFLEDDFEVIERGFRGENGEWIREEIKRPGRVSRLISHILSSYTTPPQQE